MAHRAAPAPFLTKTYQLVEEESTNDVVSWNDTGTTFVVWKMAEFARDLLPNYFKHNNFSSFVRQLNTYGFRKIVPDKWEFANDHFRRGQKDLLSQIRRREVVVIPAKVGGSSSPSNSGGSTSTSSSPATKNLGSAEASGQHAELSGENEKLRKDNESLSSELAQTKKQCEDLVSFLTKYLNVDPDHINRIMRQQSCDGDGDGNGNGNGNVNGDGDGVGEESMKLFGVWVKKRAREDKMGCAGTHPKEIKMTTVDFHGGRWMKSSKVCN